MSLDNPSPYEIQQVLAAWNTTREELLKHDPDPDPYAMETAALAETEGVKDLVTRLIRASQRADAKYKVADNMATDLEIRARRYQKRAERFRKTASDIMQIIGERRLDQPDFTLVVRRGQQKAVITGVVPDEYYDTVTERRVNNARLLDDLKQGVVVEGATLGNGPPHIAVSVK